MLDCPGCSIRIEDPTKHWCASCGTKLRMESQEGLSREGLSREEQAGLCLGNICLSPLLGVILYFVWKDEKPQKASDVCTVTIFSVIASFLLALLLALMQGTV